MSTFKFAGSIFWILFLSSSTAQANAGALNVDHLVANAENQLRGKSFQGKLSMEVRRDGDLRKMIFKIWTEGQNKTSIKILEPKKDQGSGNLKIDQNLWQYLAHVDKIIKIPPSMMLQSWMGSDFTNDDLVKASNLSKDYTHELDGRETIDKSETARISCIPKKDAAVTWGKVVIWIRTLDQVIVMEKFYKENGDLVKTMEGREIRRFGKHSIPTLITMKSAKNADSSTTIHYEEVTYDEPIADTIFSQSFLRKATSH